MTAVTGVRGKPFLYYFGGTGGGIWRTVNAGATWEVLSDKDVKTGSVGAIAVAESDSNVIYAGMGEACIRGNVSHGDGVYRSTDGGASWKNVGLAATRQISRVRVHPTNPDLVYVAALGHTWGPNADRGVFRSGDGGKTWKKVLFVDEKTGASDLAMDPANPRVLYAGFWQVVRRPWEFVSGGTGGGLFKSTDGGDSWKKLTEGLPEGTVGKVGVTASAAKPGRLWAIVEAEKGGLFRSDDGGGKWKRVNEENKLRQRAWYYSHVYADPGSPDTVWVLNVEMHKSVDGGKSFVEVAAPHGDNHDLWLDPDDASRLINGNDGGATISLDGGASWSSILNQPTAQFYRVTADDSFPYRLYGAQQDNTTVRISSRARSGAIGRTDWHDVGGCESGWVAPDPKDPDVVYAGCYGGAISRYDHRTGEDREVIAWPQLAIGQAAADLRYRFQWNAPILVSRHDRALYHAAQVLLRSKDEGETWEEVSPDLTRNDKAKQASSGGPITKDNTGVEVYGTIFALTESPHEPGVMWAGTDDGLVQVTRDGAKTWTKVTPAGMPEWIQVNAIDVSPHEKAAAYVAATMYRLDDNHPHLYKTADYGKTWTRIDKGIPDGAFTRVVREDPVRRGLLYAGTETGLYVSFDDGASWQPFQRNLPAVPITDLLVKEDDLVIATQGRSFFVLDDLSSLRQWKDETAKENVHLFHPSPAVRFGPDPSDEEPGPRTAGRNRPASAFVDFWLREKPADDAKLTLEFLDGDTVLRTFTTETKKEKEEREADKEGKKEPDEKPLEVKAGLNRFTWDLRMLKPSLVPKAVIWGSKKGPRVAPGSYTARLTLGSVTKSETLEVRANPAVRVSPEALAAQAKLLAQLRDQLTRTHDAVSRLRDVKAQAKGLTERAEKVGAGTGLKDAEKALSEKLTALEEKLVNPKLKSSQDVLNFPPRIDHEIVGLATAVSSADAAPTRAEAEYAEGLKTRLEAVLSDVEKAFDDDLESFNEKVKEGGVSPVIAPPAKGWTKVTLTNR